MYSPTPAISLYRCTTRPQRRNRHFAKATYCKRRAAAQLHGRGRRELNSGLRYCVYGIDMQTAYEGAHRCAQHMQKTGRCPIPHSLYATPYGRPIQQYLLTVSS